MHTEINVPDLPESVSSGRLMTWHVGPGDIIRQHQVLIELETDKIILEIAAPASGKLLELLASDGATVTSGQCIARMAVEEDTAEIAPVALPITATSEPPAATGTIAEASGAPSGHLAAPISPAVRRLLNEHQLEASAIVGSGREGRLTRQDVLDYLEKKAAAPQPVTSQYQPAPEPAARTASPDLGQQSAPRTQRRQTMSPLRSRIAERMLEAQHHTATLTTFNEVNLQRIADIRNEHKQLFEQKHGVKLGYMSFIVKAVVAALQQFPILNASIDGEDMIFHDFYDIGIAVSTERGLVVPILRDADQLNFADIEAAVVNFSQKARQGKLSMDDLSGGTFTITNGGIYGSMLSTPILNPPQSAILGMHAIKDRPVVENGEIVIRPIIYLALSYDHRIIDGRDAVSFLFTIKELLENPARLLLQI